MKVKTANAFSKKKNILLRYIGIVCLGCYIGLSVFYANAVAFGNNPLPMPMGTGAAVVMSGSMEPALNLDDVIFVRRAEAYEPGDIIVYQVGNMLVVHRIVSVDGESVVTKGDANNVADPAIEYGMILGRVALRIPKLGLAVYFLRSPAGIVTISALALFLMERSYRREREADDTELEAIRAEIERLKNEK